MSATNMNEALNGLRTALDNRCEIHPDNQFTVIRVVPSDLLTSMHYLREQVGMNYLANLTATDLKEEFEITFHLYAIPDNGLKFTVKTNCSRELAQVPSICSVYPTVDWQEREVYDLMGIVFKDHPNLARVLLPDDFTGHPLRKDFRKETGGSV
jgi:NADH-quinone oxidoreductase subunit C